MHELSRVSRYHQVIAEEAMRITVGRSLDAESCARKKEIGREAVLITQLGP